MRSVTVVGASLAGLSAVRALRAQGFDGRLVVVGDEQHPPYDRPPLSKSFLTGATSTADVSLVGDGDDALDVQWRLGTAAVALDAAGRAVRLATGEQLRSDAVVLATGARARPLPGGSGNTGSSGGSGGSSSTGGSGALAGVHLLRTLDDAIALRDALAGAARVVVVGAGFIGAEVASSAHQLGLDVTVVEALPTPMAGPLGDQMGAACAGLHADAGVRLHNGSGVAALVGNGRVTAVDLTDGTRLPADLVVVGIGTQPNTGWLTGSGVQLAAAGGVVTDAACATALPGVVAVGDCAASYDLHAGRVVRAEHWTHALQQPATAAATLLGAPKPFAQVPYFWSEQYGRHLQFAGSRQADDAVTVVEGDPREFSFVATYERAGRVVAVLGVDAPKSFNRWRRRLRAEHAAALAGSPTQPAGAPA